MKKTLGYEGTVKSIGVTLLAGSMFLALTGCTTNEAEGAGPNASPATASATAEATAESEPMEFPATFLRVIDGDTAEVQPKSEKDGSPVGEPLTVRLLGIDAPEMDQCGGPEAKAEFERIIEPDTAVLLRYDEKADRVDDYDRALAYMYLGPSDIASRLVSAGYTGAWYPSSEPEPRKFADYHAAAEAAKTQGKGSWATCGTLGR
jgi:micrococcal nuclease